MIYEDLVCHTGIYYKNKSRLSRCHIIWHTEIVMSLYLSAPEFADVVGIKQHSFSCVTFLSKNVQVNFSICVCLIHIPSVYQHIVFKDWKTMQLMSLPKNKTAVELSADITVLEGDKTFTWRTFLPWPDSRKFPHDLHVLMFPWQPPIKPKDQGLLCLHIG